MSGWYRWFFVLVGVCTLYSEEMPTAIHTIALGSCANQNKPQDFWYAIIEENPDVFLFLGDNIYADNMRYRRLKKEYAKLGRQPGFQVLKQTATVMATWDDHDYGLNDGGALYANKHQAKRAFLKFFQPQKSARVWHGDGLYYQRVFGEPGQRVQIIMLDSRFFRSSLKALPKDQWNEKGRYLTDHRPEKTMLGKAQWYWLENCLKQPAEVRLIITSIQAIPNGHGWEKWGNFPHERKKLFALIKRTQAKGVILISGDRHMGEISRLPANDPDGVGYPLFEITASGLNTKMATSPKEPNQYRIGERHLVNHFGLIKIRWGKEPRLQVQIKATSGEALHKPVQIQLGDLK